MHDTRHRSRHGTCYSNRDGEPIANGWHRQTQTQTQTSTCLLPFRVVEETSNPIVQLRTARDARRLGLGEIR